MARKSAIYSEASSNGTSLPVVVEGALARRDGMAPERLDDVIETLVDNAESGAALLKQYTPVLEGLMHKLQDGLTVLFTPQEPVDGVEPTPPPSWQLILDIAGKVSVIIERMSKMTMQAVKSKDDATRLRMELAKGPESVDLDNLSEGQLRKLVLDAAAGFPKEPDAV